MPSVVAPSSPPALMGLPHAEYGSLIVGQGLAGSLLAWRLLLRGERVLVVDNHYLSASSTVAAGLINPVTGKRLAKSVGVDECLPLARQTYRELELLLKASLWVEKPMLRLFDSEAAVKAWERRCQDPDYHPYLGERLAPSQLPPPVYASHGGGIQLQTAYLRTRILLEGLRDWLQQQGAYRQAQFAHADLAWGEAGVGWRDVRARRVIFCEGYKGAWNPWFDWLPFQPAKGEFLTLETDQPLPDMIINAGRWLMPRGGGRYRVGASYDHSQLNEGPTAEARRMLLDALPGFLDPPPRFEVVAQQAGVRPTTSDRQPFIGRHPHHPQLCIFNGFGSKGALLIPWHTERFVASLLDGASLPTGCDIGRYRGQCGD